MSMNENEKEKKIHARQKLIHVGWRLTVLAKSAVRIMAVCPTIASTLSTMKTVTASG